MSYRTRLLRYIDKNTVPIRKVLRLVAIRALRSGITPKAAMARRLRAGLYGSWSAWNKANRRYQRQRTAYRQRFGQMPRGRNELPR